MKNPSVPPRTAARMSGEPVKGTRHAEALALALSLLGNGMVSGAVYAQLRDHYPSDVSDFEIRNVVSWAESKNPKPSGYGDRPAGGARAARPGGRVGGAAREKKKTPEEMVRWWLGETSGSVAATLEKSPVEIPVSGTDALVLLWELLYGPEELLNVVCKHVAKEDGKASPSGSGKTLLRVDWVDYVRKNGIPSREAGAWFRINPVKLIGSGKGGAVTDSDVTSFRFLLLESDDLSMDLQLAFYSKVKLSVAAIVSSGGKSVHCWICLGSATEKEYDEAAGRVLKSLEPFGFDQVNKNPSRLSRLPGAVRQIGAIGGGVQQLYYLNPVPDALDEAKLAEFEASLTAPALDDQPLSRVARESLNRYQELSDNRGKLGVQTGLADFDRHTGGIKPGQFIVIAAETGGGKSTLALNWINRAVEAGVGVVMFSIEMDREEVMDNLMSLRCRVNRNRFNTGEFEQSDFEKMALGVDVIAGLPLWIFDEAVVTVEDIRKSVLLLNADKKIGLVVIDYVQLVSPTNPSDSREQQVAFIANGLRSLGRETRLPVIVLSQLNEEGKIRESRVIAHAANMLLMLEDLDGKKPRLRIAKGRRVKKTFYELYFDANYCHITSASKVKEEDIPRDD